MLVKNRVEFKSNLARFGLAWLVYTPMGQQSRPNITRDYPTKYTKIQMKEVPKTFFEEFTIN